MSGSVLHEFEELERLVEQAWKIRALHAEADLEVCQQMNRNLRDIAHGFQVQALRYRDALAEITAGQRHADALRVTWDRQPDALLNATWSLNPEEARKLLGEIA